MRCPYLICESPIDHVPSQCMALMTPFEAGPFNETDLCRSAHHRRCPQYQTAEAHLAAAIRNEVVRAIG